MIKALSKIKRPWILVLVVVAAAAFFGYRYLQSQKYAVPKGIASGNGRIEAKLIDVAAREPLRVKRILVDEGDLVQPGDTLVLLDTITLQAELAEAVASVAAANEQLTVVNAAILRRKSEIELARIEVERAQKLLADNAGSQRDYDVRKMYVETTQAALAEETAKLETAKQEVLVARANVLTMQTRIDDATLLAPAKGRVLYRLAEPGEVLAAGGKALTLVNLEDVYMEVFLPAADAAAVRLGAEGRITADYEPGVAARGFVTFVSPEAQFTPKEVETKSEREKLMFRVKIQIPRESVERYVEHIKTGVRGVGYVRIDESVAWPDWLQRRPVAVGAAGAASAEPDSAATSR